MFGGSMNREGEVSGEKVVESFSSYVELRYE